LRITWAGRVAKTWNGLKNFGLTHLVEEGVAEITDFGSKVAEDNPVMITKSYLSKNYPEFSCSDSRICLEKIEKEARLSLPPVAAKLSAIGAIADENLLCDPRDVPVWFGTNRKPLNTGNPKKGFSVERDTVTHFGRVIVNIPEGHKVGGQSFIKRLVKGTPGLVLRSIDPLPEDIFWDSVRASLATKVEENSLLFFLHGFNQTFEQAAIRAAQLKYDLKIPHAAFYSWPSRAHFAEYMADGTSIEAAVPHIAEFLTRLVEVAGSQKLKLHVIAHSMGSRGLLLALERMLALQKGSPSSFTIDDVIFAAADVDRERFVDCVSLTNSLSNRRTLYASQKDMALALSRQGNKMIRAGHLPPVTIAPDTDTIDVLDFDLGDLGHSYFAGARKVLGDMHDSMHHGTPVKNRFGIVEQKTPGGSYWRLT